VLLQEEGVLREEHLLVLLSEELSLTDEEEVDQLCGEQDNHGQEELSPLIKLALAQVDAIGRYLGKDNDGRTGLEHPESSFRVHSHALQTNHEGRVRLALGHHGEVQ